MGQLQPRRTHLVGLLGLRESDDVIHHLDDSTVILSSELGRPVSQFHTAP